MSSKKSSEKAIVKKKSSALTSVKTKKTSESKSPGGTSFRKQKTKKITKKTTNKIPDIEKKSEQSTARKHDVSRDSTPMGKGAKGRMTFSKGPGSDELDKRLTEIEKFLEEGLNWKGEGTLFAMQRMCLHFGNKPKDF